MSAVLLIGGARSGKSDAAQKLARRCARTHDRPITVVVTATAGDEEMAARIARHQADRPVGWTVVEAPIHLADAVASVRPTDIMVLDCMTLWLTNRIVQGDEGEAIQKSARAVALGLAARPGPTVVVSNEVGLGIVPNHRLGRQFRDLQGRLNRMLTDELDRSFVVVAGRLLPLTDEGFAQAQQVLE